MYNIIWSDVYDKSGDTPLETQIMVDDLTVKDIITTTKNEKKHQRTKKEKEKTIRHQQTQMKVYLTR